MLEVREATVVFNGGTVNEKTALDHVSLTLEAGDFATVIGSNGAGKSTLLSAIAGSLPLTSGQITLQGQDMTRMKEHRRSHAIGRLFQDPLKGTAPSMTIEENLGLAYSRGKRRSLQLGVSRKDERFFYDLLKSLNLGLEERMKTPAGHLSGGQRQALTLLMATVVTPKLLLLDEHTVALDPRTARAIMDLTQRIIERDQITTLMITHNIENALAYGNKTIVMNEGRILHIYSGEERRRLSVKDVMALYESEHAVLSDRTILGRCRPGWSKDTAGERQARLIAKRCFCGFQDLRFF